MDIYFKGYGFWFTTNEPGEPLNKLTPTYQADGVFSLNDNDSIQFRHTQSLDGIETLYSSTHKDDEFLRKAKGATLKGYKPERCWFSIASNINACTGIEQIAVIAKPESPSGVLEVDKSAVNKPQPKTMVIDGAGGQSAKTRKKLIPIVRETTESLLLIYELTNRYNIQYRDELNGPKAWGKIVSGEFTSDLIVSVSDAKKSITLNGGEKLTSTDFYDKYRKRFK